MRAGVGAANGGDGRPAGDDKLIKLALVLLVLRLGQHHVLNIQPGAAAAGRRVQDIGQE